MVTYVFIDVSRKQEYIFRNKRLRDNLLNSYVIKKVTEIVMPEGERKGESVQDVSLHVFLKRHFEGAYTVVYSGGGNSMISFNNHEKAQAFVRSYSLAVLNIYPHLELYMSLIAADEHSMTESEMRSPIIQIREQLVQQADVLKDKRRAAFRRWSYGIEKLDDSGKPMAWMSSLGKASIEDERHASDSALHRAREGLFSRLKSILAGMEPGKTEKERTVQITSELSFYKSQNDRKSYIGVIAIDGNKMGEMFKKIKTAEGLKLFSDLIEQIYAESVAAALQEHATSRSGKMLVTPVLMSGDDICIVTHAEDAINVASKILERLQAPSKKYKEQLYDLIGDENENPPLLTACAGVAIVKVAYPFFDAVQLAERLCRRAKEALYRSGDGEAMSASFIDWEIIQGQVNVQKPYEPLTERAREHHHYRIRPLRVDQAEAYKGGIMSYLAFRKLVSELSKSMTADKDEGIVVSSSFVEKVRRQMYEGWEEYRRLFKMDKTKSAVRLSQLVEDVLLPGEGNLDQDGSVLEYGAVRVHEQEYIHILNDVLEAMAFISEGEEVASSHV